MAMSAEAEPFVLAKMPSEKPPAVSTSPLVMVTSPVAEIALMPRLWPPVVMTEPLTSSMAPKALVRMPVLA